MAKLKAPNSTAVVDVPDELVGRYEAAGWVAVKEPKPASKSTQKLDK
ncbi:hypothetical protein JOE65_000694 [Arthrobacter roseus]|nr:hypothetical protein [Arthrobacter roseus]